MDDWLNAMLSRIVDGTLLPAAYFAALDCDAALDTRDRDKQFDAEWARVSQEIERRWRDTTIAEPQRTLVEDIRREAFLAVSRATGQHDIASYVSDDFDLIVRGRLVDLADPLLGQLERTYESGTFPGPPFEGASM